ncbi:MAG: hypothetical protein AB7L66_21985, partial [Gemmatimonadales bacterium]
MSRRFALASLLLLAGAGGCLFPTGLCRDETRAITVDATLTAVAGTDTGRVYLSLFEARRGEGHASSEQSVVYSAIGSLDRTTVTAIHLHRGSPAGAGEVLYEFPLVPGNVESVITNTYTREPYDGSTEFRNLFALLRDSTTSIDLHGAGPAPPAQIGPAI